MDDNLSYVKKWFFLRDIYYLLNVHTIFTKFRIIAVNKICKYMVNFQIIYCATLYRVFKNNSILIQFVLRFLNVHLSIFSKGKHKNLRENAFSVFAKFKTNSAANWDDMWRDVSNGNSFHHFVLHLCILKDKLKEFQQCLFSVISFSLTKNNIIFI